jgi:hypothetical protein
MCPGCTTLLSMAGSWHSQSCSRRRQHSSSGCSRRGRCRDRIRPMPCENAEPAPPPAAGTGFITPLVVAETTLVHLAHWIWITLAHTQRAVTKLNKRLANSRCSLRLIFPPFHIRFMAKSRAPFGSFCQSRLCSSARRLPQTRAVLASAPLPLEPAPGLRCAPEIDSASLRSTLAIYETNVFSWPTRPEFSKPKGANFHDHHTQSASHHR